MLGRSVRHLDYGQVGQFIHADQLRLQDAAIVQRHLHLHSAIHDVAVGDDVTVRRDDDAAAHAVLDLLLKMRCAASARRTSATGGKSLHLAVGGVNLIGTLRGDGHVDDRGSDPRCDRLHGAIERGERRHAVVVYGRRGVNIAVAGEQRPRPGQRLRRRRPARRISLPLLLID
jgi:hypothetical protein